MSEHDRRYVSEMAIGVVCIALVLFFGLDLTAETKGEASFRTTGNITSDVERALIELGRLDGDAIGKAEAEFGLPPDGVPDKILLNHLMGELRTSAGGKAGWSLSEWQILVGILVSISMAVLAWLKYGRGEGARPGD